MLRVFQSVVSFNFVRQETLGNIRKHWFGLGIWQNATTWHASDEKRLEQLWFGFSLLYNQHSLTAQWQIPPTDAMTQCVRGQTLQDTLDTNELRHALIRISTAIFINIRDSWSVCKKGLSATFWPHFFVTLVNCSACWSRPLSLPRCNQTCWLITYWLKWFTIRAKIPSLMLLAGRVHAGRMSGWKDKSPKHWTVCIFFLIMATIKSFVM